MNIMTASEATEVAVEAKAATQSLLEGDYAPTIVLEMETANKVIREAAEAGKFSALWKPDFCTYWSADLQQHALEFILNKFRARGFAASVVSSAASVVSSAADVKFTWPKPA